VSTRKILTVSVFYLLLAFDIALCDSFGNQKIGLPSDCNDSIWPSVLRCIISWPKGDIVDIDKVSKINANWVHTFPAADGVMGFRPPRMVETWINNKWRFQAQQLHERGVIVLASQSSVMFNKNVFSQYGLDPNDYYAVNADGQPQIAFGGEYGSNYTSCCNNPAWMELHRETTMLYASAGFEGIWYDVNIHADKNAFYCHCKYCRMSWKKYLSDNHLPSDTLLLTEASGDDMTKSIKCHHLLWRLECWQNAFVPLIDSVKKKYPHFKFSHNFGVYNPGRVEGLFFHAMTNMYDFVHYEECEHSCSPYTNIPSYLMGIACGRGKPVILVQNSKPAANNIQHKLFLAEGYAAGCFPQVGLSRYTEDTKAFFEFISRNQDYYKDIESMANVAIVISWKSRAAYDSSKSFDPPRRFAEILLSLHVPFDYIIAERDLNSQLLNRYKTVILPDLACISDEQLLVLKQFVTDGGGIVATNNFGKYTEWFNARPQNGLHLMTDKNIINSDRFEVGKGRILYFKNSPEKEYFEQNPRNLAKTNNLHYPENVPTYVNDGLKWVMNQSLPLEVEARPTTTVILKRQQHRILIHLLNYNNYEDPTKIIEDPKITITLKLLPDQIVKNISCIWAENDADFVKEWHQVGDKLTIELEKLQYYGLISINY